MARSLPTPICKNYNIGPCPFKENCLYRHSEEDCEGVCEKKSMCEKRHRNPCRNEVYDKDGIVVEECQMQNCEFKHKGRLMSFSTTSGNDLKAEISNTKVVKKKEFIALKKEKSTSEQDSLAKEKSEVEKKQQSLAEEKNKLAKERNELVTLECKLRCERNELASMWNELEREKNELRAKQALAEQQGFGELVELGMTKLTLSEDLGNLMENLRSANHKIKFLQETLKEMTSKMKKNESRIAKMYKDARDTASLGPDTFRNQCLKTNSCRMCCSCDLC